MNRAAWYLLSLISPFGDDDDVDTVFDRLDYIKKQDEKRYRDKAKDSSQNSQKNVVLK